MTGSTGLYDFLGWVEVNRNRLIGAALLAIAAGVVFAFMVWKKQETRIAADEALLKIRPPLTAGLDAAPPKPAEYLKVAADFPGTPAAERAQLLAAGAYFEEGNYTDAKSHFEKFLTEQAGHPLEATAAYGIAASLEAQGNLDAALTAYQTVTSRYGQSSLVEEAKLAVARIYESKNQPQLALNTYEELTRPSTSAGQSAEAARRREYLLKQFPELAKTNAPAATNLSSGALIAPSGSGAAPSTPALNLAPNSETNPAPAQP